jgi:hypothetical protein
MRRPRTLWFVVPAHGRLEIAAVCLRQLRRTCDQLADRGILASAVVVSDDENLELAADQGFATVERDNSQLGRRINDGYELAGRNGVEFMVALGNDDWVHPDFIQLPGLNEIVCTHLSTVVSEDCTRMARLKITYPGGDGVRIYPRHILEKVGYRPAGEDRTRAIDTATHYALRADAPTYVYRDVDPLHIVDWKSEGNLNDYDGCYQKFGRRHFAESTDPFGDLAGLYPEAVAEMQAVRGLVAA